MDIAQNNQTSTQIQLGFFESIKGLLTLEPLFFFGIVIIGIILAVMFRRNKNMLKVRTSIVSILMYYYLCVMFINIVGIPTISEFTRLSGLGESFFHPNINLIPLSNGVSLAFILNIFLFIPLGFLSPIISRIYESGKYTILLGLGMSLLIEISQLFTLYRASDIDDVLTNVLGTVIGYLCYRLIAKLKIVKVRSNQAAKEKDPTRYLPIMMIATAFIIEFL